MGLESNLSRLLQQFLQLREAAAQPPAAGPALPAPAAAAAAATISQLQDQVASLTLELTVAQEYARQLEAALRCARIAAALGGGDAAPPGSTARHRVPHCAGVPAGRQTG